MTHSTKFTYAPDMFKGCCVSFQTFFFFFYKWASQKNLIYTLGSKCENVFCFRSLYPFFDRKPYLGALLFALLNTKQSVLPKLAHGFLVNPPFLNVLKKYLPPNKLKCSFLEYSSTAIVIVSLYFLYDLWIRKILDSEPNVNNNWMLSLL